MANKISQTWQLEEDIRQSERIAKELAERDAERRRKQADKRKSLDKRTAK